jgi:DNA-directed RNA polymerase subunit RPC12/RpoP
MRIEDGVIVHAPADSDPDEDDGLPWECGSMRCVLCGHEAPVVTHWPMVRKDLECPQCGGHSMN